jgi:hypothetical protein
VTVVVVVEKCDASSHGFREQFVTISAVDMRKGNAGFGSDVRKSCGRNFVLGAKDGSESHAEEHGLQDGRDGALRRSHRQAQRQATE